MQPTPMERRFDTYADYRQAMAEILELATGSLRIFDTDLRNLGFDSKAGADALQGFLVGGRNRAVQIVVHDSDFFERHCPRLESLYRRYNHVMGVRRTPDSLKHLTECFAVADASHLLVRFHADHPRGKLLLFQDEPVAEWIGRFNEIWELSQDPLPVTRLGL